VREMSPAHAQHVHDDGNMKREAADHGVADRTKHHEKQAEVRLEGSLTCLGSGETNEATGSRRDDDHSGHSLMAVENSHRNFLVLANDYKDSCRW
jgi:hypothetical protein